MGQKHVKVVEDVGHLESSEGFLNVRKIFDRKEYPAQVGFVQDSKSEDSLPYPSSLSEVFPDSEDVPERKVKIRKTLPCSSTKHKKNFKKRIKKFEYQEFKLAQAFKENHVKFNDDVKENTSNEEFRIKVKLFERNESRISLLKKKKESDVRRRVVSDFSWSGSCKNRMISTISTVRSWKPSYAIDDW